MPHVRNVGGVSPQPFFVLPAVSNVVPNGNGTGTKNVLKGTMRLGLCLIIQSSVYSAITVAKVSLWIRSTVRFYSM